MLPQYQYTEYISPMGNTQIYIYRRKHTKPFLQRFLTSRRYAVARQKLLGLALVVIGIIGMMVFTDDATAPCVITFLGMIRMFCR